MAIDIFPKHWSAIPPISARAVQGHPLCPRFGFLFNGGAAVDIVRGVVGNPYAGSTKGTWSPGSIRGYAGMSREHTASTDRVELGDGNLLLPNNDVTLVVGQTRQVFDARDARCIGGANATASGFIVGAYVPFSDGNVYWDWGTTSAGRLGPIGGLASNAYGDVWAFTTGPRAQEIWQNGLLRATKSPAADKGTYGAGTEQLALGMHAAVQNSDLVKYHFVYVYWRQLLEREMAEIAAFPFCWVDPRS